VIPVNDLPMPSAAEKRRVLRKALASGSSVFAPGVYDGFGLRIIERYPVDAAYVSGNAVSACLLGEPDVGLVDLTLLTSHLSRLSQCSRLPLIADADAGFGSVVNIRRAVRALEAAGVAAIHIEDQPTPKRCAQLPGARSVLSHDEAVSRIDAACCARIDSDPLIIVGRTDCAAAHGLDEAIHRARDFVAAGAEAVFVELKSTSDLLDQIRTVSEQVKAPCLVNMSVDERLMALNPDQWRAHGISIGIFPSLARGSFGHALQANMARLLAGETQALINHLMPPQDYAETLGLSVLERWEQRFRAGSQA
jgi:2-methylisocitrate lyase-like PEP mutase family enzyme